MKTTLLIGALALASFATAANAESDPYEPYEYELTYHGSSKRQAYDHVMVEAPKKCDAEGGFVANVRYDYIGGWGSLANMHFLKATVLCKPTRPEVAPRPVADLPGSLHPAQ
ncbi:hypothetical protein [Luteibacter sp. E-22]|uniref:hypothetical protein n=1 Tax=Luteibacter sp. E-22 TaxID=3404050 RepID=UPI003CF66FE3